jgi:hypothetical protein
MLTPTETPWLLDKLCVDAGFCPSPEEKEKGKLQANPLTDPIAWTNIWPGVVGSQRAAVNTIRLVGGRVDYPASPSSLRLQSQIITVEAVESHLENISSPASSTSSASNPRHPDGCRARKASGPHSAR